MRRLGFALGVVAACWSALAQSPELPLTRASVLDVVALEGGATLRGLSGLAWDVDEAWLVGVTDHGWLHRWRVDQVGERIAAVTLLGSARLDARRVDAESLCLLDAANGERADARVLVAAERAFEVIETDYEARLRQSTALPSPLVGAKGLADENRGVEAIECHPRHGLIAAPQRPLPPRGREVHFAYAADGRVWAWKAAHGRSTVKAMHLVNERQLLVLERLNSEVGDRPALRELDLTACTPHSPCDPPVVVLDDPRLGSERYEGLACRDERHCWIVSDGAAPRLARLRLGR